MDINNKVTSLTLQKDYDSEFCGSIPLHLVNLVQPHGFVFVLEKSTFKVLQVSENITSYFDSSVDHVLDMSFKEMLSQEQYDDICNKLENQESDNKIPLSLELKIESQSGNFTTILHPKENYVIAEFEPSSVKSNSHESFINLYQRIKFLTTKLKNAETVQKVSELAVTELKRLSGFDKVMVYKFDPKWNGLVIAEAKEPDMDEYLGLHFPASDVPKQARQLYFRNPYRLIPNRSYEPVKLLPIINPLTQQFTDLTDCHLRGVAAVHLEYMQNMGIEASMSLPIIIKNKLWGLISCHHKTAKYLSYELRSAMELLVDMVSVQIAAKEVEDEVLLKAKLRGIHSKLLAQVYKEFSLADALLDKETSILDLLNLTGAVLILDGATWQKGDVPDNSQLRDLLVWLRRNKFDSIYATDNLPGHFKQSEKFKDFASGLIVLPINIEQGEYLLGFRREVTQTITWGGNPNEAIQMEADGKSYHPRNSFTTFKEEAKFTSIPWLEEELNAAEALRSTVLEKIIKERF